jgi:hypothetical protein
MRGDGAKSGYLFVNSLPPQMAVPAMPPIEHYGPAMARFALGAMRRAAPLNPAAPRIVMYLSPWYRQAAAWFAVGFGIAMAARAGTQVEFLINDLPYPSIHPFELNEIAALDAFCREFEAMFPARRLSSFCAPVDASRRAVIDGVVAEALRLDVRHRTGAGTLNRAQAASFPLSARTPLTHIAQACDAFLAAERPDVLFCPGGAANGSYAVRRLAEIHGIRFASADSNFNVLILAGHGIAGHIVENAETVKHIQTLPASIRDEACARGYRTLDAKIQAASTTQLPPCDLLMPLGYDWDTSALGIATLYESQDDWVRETIDYVSRVHPDARIVLRQHPQEVEHPSFENSALFTELERRNLSNLNLMRAQDRIPVYGLLEKAKACVACQSTVALEAQMRGVPTVSMRETYYVVAGAITRPPTREAYFKWLDEKLRGDRDNVPQSIRDTAALSYFVLTNCVDAPTRFNPIASELWNWLHTDPVADLASDGVGDLIRCVVADVPLATLRGRRLLGLPALPESLRDPLAM